MNEKEWKEWFEQNFLDGDPIQKGQMLSSEECLEAVMETQRLERERIRRIVKSRLAILDTLFVSTQGIKQDETASKINELNDLLSKLYG
jgi:agmatine/peptidylarginine deiminase